MSTVSTHFCPHMLVIIQLELYLVITRGLTRLVSKHSEATAPKVCSELGFKHSVRLRLRLRLQKWVTFISIVQSTVSVCDCDSKSDVTITKYKMGSVPNFSYNFKVLQLVAYQYWRPCHTVYLCSTDGKFAK